MESRSDAHRIEKVTAALGAAHSQEIHNENTAYQLRLEKCRFVRDGLEPLMSPVWLPLCGYAGSHWVGRHGGSRTCCHTLYGRVSCHRRRRGIRGLAGAYRQERSRQASWESRSIPGKTDCKPGRCRRRACFCNESRRDYSESKRLLPPSIHYK